MYCGVWVQKTAHTFYNPFYYVSMGIAVAAMLGIQNVGTHNEKLWMVDISLSGINRLRVALDDINNGDNRVYWEAQYGAPAKAIRQAMAAAILWYIGGWLAWYSTLPKIKIHESALVTRATLVSFVCFLIGAVCIWTNDVSTVPHTGGNQSLTTAHLFQSPEPVYFKFLNLTWLAYLVYAGNMGLALHGCQRSYIVSAWGTAWLTFSLVTLFQVAQDDSTNCGTFFSDVGLSDSDTSDQCATLTAGLLFLFFQTTSSMLCLYGGAIGQTDPAEVATPADGDESGKFSAVWATDDDKEKPVVSQV